MADTNMKLRKMIINLARVVFACLYPAYTIILALATIYFIQSEDDDAQFGVIALITSVLALLFFECIDKKAQTKSKYPYVVFEVVMVGTLSVCGLLWFHNYRFVSHAVTRIIDCAEYAFLTTSLFLWAIKRIRFRWALLSFITIFFIGSVISFSTYLNFISK